MEFSAFFYYLQNYVKRPSFELMYTNRSVRNYPEYIVFKQNTKSVR
jgi:hypothetical protein